MESLILLLGPIWAEVKTLEDGLKLLYLPGDGVAERRQRGLVEVMDEALGIKEEGGLEAGL